MTAKDFHNEWAVGSLMAAARETTPTDDGSSDDDREHGSNDKYATESDEDDGGNDAVAVRQPDYATESDNDSDTADTARQIAVHKQRRDANDRLTALQIKLNETQAVVRDALSASRAVHSRRAAESEN